MRISLTQLQRGILAFWALWFGLVTLSNLFDALLVMHVVGPGMRFVSGNYALIGQVTGKYGVPGWVNAPLFGGVIAWETVATFLFARAAAGWRADGGEGVDRARTAFAAAIALWATFLVLDEAFIAYDLEGSHMSLLLAHLLSLLVIELLRERGAAAPARDEPRTPRAL